MAKRDVTRGPVPVTRVFDAADMVNRLDPGRHLPSVEYEFSNGETFESLPGDWYDEAGGD